MNWWVTYSHGKQAFDTHPIWTWDEERGFMIPIEEINNFLIPENLTEFEVRADLKISRGDLLPGFIAYHDLSDAFTPAMHPVRGIGIFVDEDRIHFKKNFDDLDQGDLMSLAAKLNCDPSQIFPIQYSTPFHFLDKDPIEGYFNIEWR